MDNLADQQSPRLDRVLVIGDLMLDRYTWGDIERVSPEAPVLVLRAELEEVRLGGAASVASLLAGLGLSPVVAGVVGADAPGRIVRRLLAELPGQLSRFSVPLSLVSPLRSRSLVLIDSSRPTTVKDRLLGRSRYHHPQQLLRVDHESQSPLDSTLEERLIATCLEALGNCRAVLISDYGKGVCTPRLLAVVIEAAKALGIPVLVDPARDVDYGRYRGAALVKPNRLEAEAAVGRRLVTAADALAAGSELCERWGIAAAVVTLDQDGMVLAQADGPAEYFPTRVQEICDVTGAGDTVLAVLGAALVEGQSLETGCDLANHAAGLQVRRPGVSPITRAEILASGGNRENDTPGGGASMPTRRSAEVVTELAVLAPLVHGHRSLGRRIVFTNGCFDLLHAGHVSCLEQAAAHGDLLVVAINSDSSVRRLKGAGRPVIEQAARAAMVAALAVVDYVIVFDEDTPEMLIRTLVPDVLVKGREDRPCEIPGAQFVLSRGGQVKLADPFIGLSTTSLVQRIREPGESPLVTRTAIAQSVCQTADLLTAC